MVFGHETNDLLELYNFYKLMETNYDRSILKLKENIQSTTYFEEPTYFNSQSISFI